MSFIPLAEFDPPALPTQEWLRAALGKARALVGRDDAKPFIADDALQRATRSMLEDVVSPPACGPLLDALDDLVAEWSADRGRQRTRLIVLPPCEEGPLLGSWAERAGHTMLEPPARAQLIAADGPVPDLGGDGLLVIPRLEAWFLRHRNGIRLLRQLLAGVDAGRRPMLLGCNSFAWEFLRKAAGADNLLPDPLTFAPFDAARLHVWFSELAQAEATSDFHFRRASTGADVFAVDADGVPVDDFLRVLAGHSLGIPWVAWHLWRRSLRSSDAELSADDAGERQTLWIAALDEFTLPGNYDQSVFLVLHALLIHGPLTAEELRLVLPLVGESSVVSVLVKSGFVERRGDRFACSAGAYPAIRTGLQAAGLPLGKI